MKTVANQTSVTKSLTLVNSVIRTSINLKINIGIIAQKEVIERVTKSLADAIYELSWLEDKAVLIQQGVNAQIVKGVAENIGEKNNASWDSRQVLIEAFTAAIDTLQNQLLRNQHRGSSTSQYHNATEAAIREAACRDIPDFKYAIHCLSEKE